MKAISRILKIVGVLYIVIVLFDRFGVFGGDVMTPAMLIGALVAILSAMLHGFGAIALGVLLDRVPSRG